MTTYTLHEPCRASPLWACQKYAGEQLRQSFQNPSWCSPQCACWAPHPQSREGCSLFQTPEREMLQMLIILPTFLNRKGTGYFFLTDNLNKNINTSTPTKTSAKPVCTELVSGQHCTPCLVGKLPTLSPVLISLHCARSPPPQRTTRRSSTCFGTFYKMS